MSNDEYMMCLRQNILDVADAMRAENIEQCRNALRSIALGLIPESLIEQMATCVLRERRVGGK